MQECYNSFCFFPNYEIVKQYSLFLKIADLVLQITSENPRDVSYLSDKYTDFIVKRKTDARNIYRVSLTNYQPVLPKQTGRNFLLHMSPVWQHFPRFNDFFRMVFAFMLHHHSGLLIHASVLVQNNRSFVFVGPEGAGKSTVRLRSQNMVCLGDDTAIIRKKGAQFYAYGSPFYQKTNRSYPNKSCPLASIFTLQKTSYTMVKRLGISESLATFISQTQFSSFEGNNSEKTSALSTVSTLCQYKKCFQLCFSLHKPFWPLVIYAIKTLNFSTETRPSLSPINSEVARRLPKNISWSYAVADTSFLKKCLVLREASWVFEFPLSRHIHRIAADVINPKRSSNHQLRIAQKTQQLSVCKEIPWIVLLQHGNLFTIVDGNHTAVAAYLLGKKNKNVFLRLIIGEAQSSRNRMI